MDQNSQLYIEAKAVRLLRLGKIKSCPVNLDDLDHWCGVVKKEVPFSQTQPVKRLLKKLLKGSALDELKAILERLKEMVAFYLQHNKMIVLNQDCEAATRRWGHAHELGHASLGHESHFYTDNDLIELDFPEESMHWQELEEAEANYFASCLIFPKDEWKKMFKDQFPFLQQAPHLMGYFGASRAATLRKMVECSQLARCLVLLPCCSNEIHVSYTIPAYITSPRWKELVAPRCSELLLTELMLLRKSKISFPNTLWIECMCKQSKLAELEITYNQRYQFIICTLTN